MKEPSEERIRSAANLDTIGRDLTHLASENMLGMIYEREEEIKKLASFLSTEGINLILVGKPGTGKNAIVEGLAMWIALSDKDLTASQERIMSSALQNKRIIETGADAFIHECFYAHEFETKLKYIIDECKKNEAILFLDNINMVIDAGSTGQSPDRTLANLLIRYLSGKDLTIIGATTPEGYETMIKSNPAFTQRFVKLDVLETSPEQTKNILYRLKDKFERKYEVAIDDKSLDVIVDLSIRFFPERAFPGKAFELLNEVISKKIITNRILSIEDVYKTVQEKTGFPDFIIYRNKTVTKEMVRDFFKEKLFGQDHAIEVFIDIILSYKVELNDPTRPIGAFLFAGPTGVGKTELAKLLAEFLFGSEERLHRYDMSNYADDRGLLRLVEGSRLNEQGKLFSETIANPCCVTLFDEIEKARPEIFNLLLPILDEGKLIDHKGRAALFNNSIIIMTSNLGTELYLKKPITLGPAPESISESDIFKKIQERFSPEFINRINRIIYFKPLDRNDVEKIVRKELGRVFRRSGSKWRNLNYALTKEVIEIVVAKGYSAEYGARAIQRAIEEEIVYPLATMFSSMETVKDKTIKLTVKKGKVVAGFDR